MISFVKNTALGAMFNRIKTLNEAKFFIEIMSDKIVQKFIVVLNTDQMRFEYINSEGEQLSSIGGEYSDFTVEEGNKSSKFNVDLYDEGDFHESFRIENINGKGFEINSDHVKNGTDLLEQWGLEIEGLTFESLDKAVNFILGFYQRKLLKTLLG